jgi:hypothetical protein
MGPLRVWTAQEDITEELLEQCVTNESSELLSVNLDCLIHSLNEYLWTICYMPNTVLGAWDISVIKKMKDLCP